MAASSIVPAAKISPQTPTFSSSTRLAATQAGIHAGAARQLTPQGPAGMTGTSRNPDTEGTLFASIQASMTRIAGVAGPLESPAGMGGSQQGPERQGALLAPIQTAMALLGGISPSSPAGAVLGSEQRPDHGWGPAFYASLPHAATVGVASGSLLSRDA